MAHVTDIRIGGTSFSARFEALRTDLAARWAAYRTYRTTLNELGALSNADLRDLGLTRGELHDVATKAAYGHSA